MKVFLCLAILAACAASPFAKAQEAAAYVVCDATTGHILQQENANSKRQVASLTKIATAMVALDWTDLTKRDLGEVVTIPAGADQLPGINSVGLMPGDQATLRDLLYSALLQSDNTAAEAIAQHIGSALQDEGLPSDRFVAQMNALARRLGMKDTRFRNAHGLDSAEDKLPYSTAADMARLTKYAMASSAFRFYVSQKERQISITRAAGTVAGYQLQNTNELLGVEEIDGVKTGRTRRAGDCVIISSAKSPETKQEGDQFIITPRRLIVVVLGSPSRFPAAKSLLSRGWSDYDQWAANGRPEKRGRSL